MPSSGLPSAAMGENAAKGEQFLALHRPGDPLLMPNAWDQGSARLFAHLGFHAVATTSSGFAATLGRLDGTVTRDEAIAHARDVAQAVRLPVSADLENCFACDPAGVPEPVPLGGEAGLAVCSVKEATGQDDAPIFDAGLATERVAA